ncbi:Molybdopterin molybdenumtransferase [Symmachiella macrocystis]|uniref:Molybdopterin molybdenumtransferase n=1 Tax=Symmachiella macrocystis TaxID=2527985 RepID=A0A5C6BBM7_9PLAN|nr:gephyrin-like molybdotransferase Glp [Symmachiella macrocystis]TWU09388.1 Molybdopterin molybdenumtransferase [Symmachiella macrocystis]
MTGGSSSHLDVRMRGFSARALVAQVREWIDQQCIPLSGEEVEIAEAHGRVLAADVVSTIDVPEFYRAAMDGYALRGAETTGAGDYNRLAFDIVGESLPGHAFAGGVQAGQAVRIMTGAPIPDGADAVLPAEYASENDNRVEISTAVAPQKHVAPRGEDVKQGTTIAAAGRRLRPQDVGLLASVGCATVPIIRQPRVRILATGNEIVQPGSERKPHQIFDANSHLLGGLIARDGGELESCSALADSREAIREALIAPGADVVLVTGGSSVGAEDHAPMVLAAEGELAIHGIAMRPSSPAGMGTIGKRLVFLLPGNPVSCLCAYDFFAGRAIRLLGGRSADWPYARRSVPVGRKIVSAVGRMDYVRVAIVDGRVEPLAVGGASILSSTTRADGFVIVPESSEGVAPGGEVTYYQYDSIS